MKHSTRNMYQFMQLGILLGLSVILGCSSAKLERHLKRADRFYARGQYREAAIEYTNVLRLKRLHSKALSRLAICRYELGDLHEAGQLLLAAREVDPTNPEIGIRLGKMFLIARNFKEAYQIASDLVSSNPTNHEAVLLLCESAISTDQWSRAEQALEVSRLKAVRPVTYHLARGNMCIRRGEREAAEKEYHLAAAADPKAGQPHEALGKLYALQGDFDRAEAELRTAMEINPPGSRAGVLLAELKWDRDQHEEAKKILQGVLEQDPYYSPALIFLGRIAMAERDYAEALVMAERILAKKPGDFTALLLRVQSLFAKGDLQQSLRECEGMLKRFPNSAPLYHQMAMIRVKQQDLKKALASAKKATECDPDYVAARFLLAELQIVTGDTASAVELLRGIIQEHPGSVQAHLLLGSALRAQQKPEQAVPVYEKAIAFMPNEPRLHYALGVTLREKDEEERASNEFEKALSLKPGWIAPLTQLVIRDVRKKDFDAAVQRVKEQMEKAGEKAELKVLLAKVCIVQNKLGEAETVLLEAIQLNPRLTVPYQLLASIYSATQREADAIKKLEESLVLNPEDTASMMLAAVLYQKAGRRDKAIELYERILHSKSRFIPAANNLAYLYLEDPGKLGKALELAQMARDVAPNDPYVADTLGWVLYHKGDVKWALSLLRESVEHLPDQPEVLYHLGAVHYRLGNIKPARDALEKSLAAETQFPGKDKIRSMLEMLDLDPHAPSQGALLDRVQSFLVANPNDVMALYRRAQIWESLGKQKEAERAYEAITRDHPYFAPVYVSYAGVLARRPAKREKALELIRRARELNPDDPEIAQNLGWWAHELGEYLWANSLLRQAAARLPDDPQVAYRLGISFYALGQVEESIRELQRALGAKTSFPEAESAKEMLNLVQAWTDSSAEGPIRLASLAATLVAAKREDLPALMIVAKARQQQGDLQGAIRIYEDICARYPEFVLAGAELAALYVETDGDTEKAYRLALKARERLPKDAWVAGILGMVAYCRGNYEWSANLCGERLSVSPEDTSVLYYRGLALYKLQKENDAARNLLTRALAAAPEHKMAPEARRVLEELSSKR